MLKIRAVAHLGKPILTYFEDAKDSIIWFWSLVVAGAVPILLPPLGEDQAATRRCFADISRSLDKPSVLTSSVCRELFVDGHDALRIHTAEAVLCGKRSRTRSVDLVDHGIGRGDETAAVFLTSVTKDALKTIRCSHSKLLASSEWKRWLLAGDYDAFKLAHHFSASATREPGQPLHPMLTQVLISILRVLKSELYPARPLALLGLDAAGCLRLKLTLESIMAQHEKRQVTFSTSKIMACQTLRDLEEYVFNGDDVKALNPFMELTPPGSKLSSTLCPSNNCRSMHWLLLLS